MKRLIIFATKLEAAATLEHLKAHRKQETLYECQEGLIVISGMGCHAAQQAVCNYASSVDEVWNLGIAGSLHPEDALGSLHCISTIDKYVPLYEELDPISFSFVRASFPTLSLSAEGRRLISSDFPIHTPTHHKTLISKADLIDMEGYGIAYAAHDLGKKCRLWKIVSDFASPEGRSLIKTHMDTFSMRLAEKVLFETQLATYPP